VRFEVDEAGTIARVAPNSPRDGATLLAGAAVPGMPNAHSHVFQRTLAGRTEATAADDSFWGWRRAMYAFLEHLDPDLFEALAADAYVEMLKAGYTSVAEFHYLHHGPGGVPYAHRTEMSERVLAGARAAGIGLTLLPVFYRYGDFGTTPPAGGQARFVNDLDGFTQLWRELARMVSGMPLVRLGAAPHSLRAVAAEDLPRLLAAVDAGAPVHIHVSEQMREVQACRAYYGTTPLEVLSKSVTLDERWSLVHATHATPAERSLVAAAGCVVVLCPTTEANLGDGIFAASDFVAGGGRIAIGSDSNVSLDVAEELRWLEYGQRLTLQRRGVLRSPGRSLAGGLFERCAKGGRQALAQPVGAFAPGSRADFVVLEEGDEQNGPSMNRYVFKSGAWRVRDVIVAGRYVVRDGHHAQEEAIRRRALRAAASIA